MTTTATTLKTALLSWRRIAAPYDNPHPLLYDPAAGTVTVSAVDVSAVAPAGCAFCGGLLLSAAAQ